jgi:hypothetical protein
MAVIHIYPWVCVLPVGMQSTGLWIKKIFPGFVVVVVAVVVVVVGGVTH